MSTEHKNKPEVEEILHNDETKLKFYEKLRNKITKYVQSRAGKRGGKFVEYLLALPDLFILITRLAVDKRVPKQHKLFMGGILAYLILPIDIIPDFIPYFGLVDDLVLVVYGLNLILNELDEQILLDNWSGQTDILQLLKNVSSTAENFLDKNILRKIRNWLGKIKG
jgi:uncharacterized membrane protein YkvA (DUF1232 family)